MHTFLYNCVLPNDFQLNSSGVFEGTKSRHNENLGKIIYFRNNIQFNLFKSLKKKSTQQMSYTVSQRFNKQAFLADNTTVYGTKMFSRSLHNYVCDYEAFISSKSTTVWNALNCDLYLKIGTKQI